MAEPDPRRSRSLTSARRSRILAPSREEQRRSFRRIPPAAVPSFFTLMNLFSGFIAITQIHDGRFAYACWLIVLAGFFDLLDGMMARLTKSQSPFGVELDSLADVVSFGLAPSYLVYVYGLKPFGMFGVIVAALPAICGAVRLARFNVTFDGEKKDHFTGLPIPVQAAAIVALVLNVDADTLSRYSMGNVSMLVPIVVLLSGLMVSTVPFDAGPRPTASYLRTHPRKFILYTIGFLLILFLQHRGLLLALTIYLLFGITRASLRLIRLVGRAPLEDDFSR